MSAHEPTLWDAQDAADAAVAQVATNADSEWWGAVERIVRGIARGVEFTTDEVWATLALPALQHLTAHEPRALGAVMRSLAADGVIRPTGRYEKSKRVACHGRPVAVWVRT